MAFHCWWCMDYDHLLSLYLCCSSQLSAAWSQWVPRGGLCSSALQGRAREAKMTDVDRALWEKQNRLSTAVEALHSQPWVALARQGWFLIKNFNYNSVIENRKEHIGPSLIQNSQTTASMAYSHFSGGDHPCIGPSKHLDTQRYCGGRDGKNNSMHMLHLIIRAMHNSYKNTHKQSKNEWEEKQNQRHHRHVQTFLSGSSPSERRSWRSSLCWPYYMK